MSTFGQYVHLHWKNYEKDGPYRSIQGKSRNYMVDHMLSTHETIIQSQINALKINNIKKLENEYNDQLKESYKALENLQKNTSKNGLNKLQNLIQNLLGQINKRWSDPAIAYNIAKDIHYDDVTNSFKYRPSGAAMAISYTGKSEVIGFPPDPWAQERGYHLAKSVINYGKKVGAVLKQKYKDTSYQDRQLLSQQIKDVIKLSDKDWMVKNESYQNGLANAKQVIDSVVVKYSSILEIERQINAAFAEMLGNTLGSISQGMTESVIEQALSNGLKIGRTQTARTQQPGLITLNFNTAKIDYDTKGAKSSVFNRIEKKNINYKTGQEQIWYQYEMKAVGEPRDQKADIEIALSGKIQGISMKNIDLTKQFRKDIEGNLIPNRISAQQSSLMLYLVGIEQMLPKMGTNYLNILAEHNEHEDDLSGYYAIRQKANRVLAQHILYSALTGQMQTRGAATGRLGFANIFAVQDKAKITNTNLNRVRFYDISILINDILDNDMDAISPWIQFIKLKNDKDPADDKMAPSRRITKLLIDAREQQIAVNLSLFRLHTLNDGIRKSLT